MPIENLIWRVKVERYGNAWRLTVDNADDGYATMVSDVPSDVSMAKFPVLVDVMEALASFLADPPPGLGQVEAVHVFRIDDDRFEVLISAH